MPEGMRRFDRTRECVKMELVSIMKNKIIRDSVHGYIAIPDDYITQFIDTDSFQRLRNIEQTSMRCLYPCARHDRFTHSIGTFHIGRQLIQALINNLKQSNKECHEAFSCTEWETISKTFEIACLLHDCAHAPFSHVIEKYMDRPFSPEDGKAGLLVKLLSSETASEKEDPSFSDIDRLKSCTSNHEKASALLLWRAFGEKISLLGAKPLLAMRMILGYTYTPASNLKEKILNCIFSLLNGTYMDADKLDYIVRDTSSSGIDNFSVDLKRLIDSVTIVKLKNGMYTVGYLKTSINVIQNMISAKNNLYLWIYAHHKVQYYSNLLCYCFEKAVGILFEYDKAEDILATCSHLVSVDAMLDRTSISSKAHEEIIYLPCDADILCLIKKAYNVQQNDSDFKELFSRKYKKAYGNHMRSLKLCLISLMMMLKQCGKG